MRIFIGCRPGNQKKEQTNEIIPHQKEKWIFELEKKNENINLEDWKINS